MWISGVEHNDSIFVYSEKWPPQQVQLSHVTMKVTKIFSLWWELPGSTLLVIEVNDFLLMVLESQMQQT